MMKKTKKTGRSVIEKQSQGQDSPNSWNQNGTIEQRAYEIFEKRGYGHGQDFDDWLEAERQVKQSIEIR